MVLFKKNTDNLTFGIETEIQVLDNDSLDLVPRAGELLAQTSVPSLTKELFQSTIELISPVFSTIHQADDFLTKNLTILKREGEAMGLRFATTGTHPFANYTDRLITPSPRYQHIVSKNRWLIRRMAVYGLHIHLGMRSGQECIRYHNFMLRFVPHLIALSASSPFWHGVNTELAACRPTMYEALPTAGIPYPINSWEAYEELIGNMISANSITTLKDIWWDLRPSPDLGTLEIRICDGPATQYELTAIVAFIHALGYWFEQNEQPLEWTTPLPHWILRENKWRSIRDGLSAQFIAAEPIRLKTITDDLNEWLSRLEPIYLKLNYEKYFQSLQQIINQGNSSKRQNDCFSKTKSLREIALLNTNEFSVGKPHW